MRARQSLWTASQGWSGTTDGPANLLLAFGGTDAVRNKTLWNDLTKRHPDAILIGCSTGGEIHGTEVLDESLSDTDPWEAGFEAGDELNFLREGLASDTLRKLRRGHWVVQGALDLHGHTAVEARAALAGFLHACVNDGLRCVRIVHGKGLRSKNREPVLKTKVANWLRQRDEVLAYCQARQCDGGSGAVIVLLKTRR